jgi:CobQ-like glutamine amidotransferase family enzyme
MRLKVATFFGSRLNLNGDQANLQVLQTRARAYGFELEVNNFELPEGASGADLIFIGHGSIAAWQSIKEEFLALEGVLENHLVLAIGSGAERVAQALGTETTRGERVSKFVEHQISLAGKTQNVVGYENSETRGIDTRFVGKCLLTLLHGPVLAKNPDLADFLLGEMLKQKELEFEPKPQSLFRLDQLAEAARSDALR